MSLDPSLLKLSFQNIPVRVENSSHTILLTLHVTAVTWDVTDVTKDMLPVLRGTLQVLQDTIQALQLIWLVAGVTMLGTVFTSHI